MKIKIINKSQHPLPKYQTALSAGMDLYANLDESLTLKSLERKLIPTGLFLELPSQTEKRLIHKKRNYGFKCARNDRCRLPWRDWGNFSKFVDREFHHQ